MNKNIIWIFVIALLAGCSSPEPVKLSGVAQGTYYAITYYDDKQRNFKKPIDSLLADFDKTASVYEPSSVISKVNKNEPCQLNDTFIEIFRKGMDVSAKTAGKFDMTVMPLVNAWGFGFETRQKLDSAKVDSILDFVGYEKIALQDNKIVKEDPQVELDFNSIAQGYSVDLLADYLESKGIKRYLIDIGGEVYANGKKPGGGFWKVGIEKPAHNRDDARKVKAILALRNKALATSGSYRKYYESEGVRYSHTIDPETGFPVQHSLLSASVLADDAVTADAYATAFMVMGLEASKAFIKENPDLEAYFIFSDRDGKLKTDFTEGIRKLLY